MSHICPGFCPQLNATRNYIHVYVYISLCKVHSGQDHSQTLGLLDETECSSGKDHAGVFTTVKKVHRVCV